MNGFQLRYWVRCAGMHGISDPAHSCLSLGAYGWLPYLSLSTLNLPIGACVNEANLTNCDKLVFFLLGTLVRGERHSIPSLEATQSLSCMTGRGVGVQFLSGMKQRREELGSHS